MRFLRCAMVALALAASSSGAALAQKAPADPARIAAAKEVMEASGTAKQFDAVMPMMFGQLGGAFSKVAPDKGSVIKEVMDKLLPKFSARKQELIDQIAELYAREIHDRRAESDRRLLQTSGRRETGGKPGGVDGAIDDARSALGAAASARNSKKTRAKS